MRRTNLSVAAVGFFLVAHGMTIAPSATAQCVGPAPAYVARAANDTVAVINTDTNTIVDSISVGDFPVAACVLPDRTEIYVTNLLDDTVSVIDLASSTVTNTIAVGGEPWSLGASPDSGEVYVANSLDDTVSVINTVTKAVTHTIAVGSGPFNVVVLPDGSEAYVCHFDPVEPVKVINTTTKLVTHSIPVGSQDIGIAVTSDGSEVWVANQSSGDISVIDTGTRLVTDTIVLPSPAFPRGLDITSDGSEVYVADQTGSEVHVIDASTKTLTDTILMGGAAGLEGLMLHPDGDEGYVLNQTTWKLQVFDTSTKTVTDTINVGFQPFGFGRFVASREAIAPLQPVFLDFGQVGVPSAKASTDIFKEDGSLLMTLDKGPRAGFDPEDIGYAPGTDRDTLIQEIVDKVTADYCTIDGQELDLRFSTTVPDFSPYTTVSIVAGDYPDMVIQSSVPGTEIRVETANNRLALTSGIATGYYVLIEDGRLRRPDTSLVPGVTYPEFTRIKVNAFGAAQQLDRGNKDKNKNAWVFVGPHNQSVDPDENLNELANSISHELAHMVGLEHRDGKSNSLLGSLDSYGTDKGFTDSARDKVTELLPPCEGYSGVASGLRVRDAKIGDSDQYGTSELGTITGMPDEDAEAIFNEARRLFETHVTHDPRFEFKLADVSQSDPEDGLLTDIELAEGTSALFSLDLMTGGIDGSYVSGRIDIDVTNVADVLGGPDDLELWVEGMEFEGAFDGMDQRIAEPEFAGYAFGERVTFDLHDYLNIAEIETVLADGVIDVTIEVEGDTPFIVVDAISAIVSDKGPDAVRTCGYGTVNLAAGRRTDVLFLNGTTGGELSTVAASAGETIWGGILLPPAGGIGKFVLHMNSGEPQESDVTELPASIGTSCFPMLLPTATPLSVWNNIGKTHLVGSSNYFSSPISNPGRAPDVFLMLSGGDTTNLPVGTTVTIQGVIFDPATHSTKGVSATNGVIVRVL